MCGHASRQYSTMRKCWYSMTHFGAGMARTMATLRTFKNSWTLSITLGSMRMTTNDRRKKGMGETVGHPVGNKCSAFSRNKPIYVWEVRTGLLLPKAASYLYN